MLCVSRLPAPKKDGRPWKTELVVQVFKALAAVPADAMLVVTTDTPASRVTVENGRSGLLSLDVRLDQIERMFDPLDATR